MFMVLTVVGHLFSIYLALLVIKISFSDDLNKKSFMPNAKGIIWFVAWMLLVAKSPSEHKFISEREKAYIIETTKNTVSAKGKHKTPWLAILKSKVFWSLVISLSCSHFGTYLFLTQLPTYMREILKFDIKSVCINLLKRKKNNLILKFRIISIKEWSFISFTLCCILVLYYSIQYNRRRISSEKKIIQNSY